MIPNFFLFLVFSFFKKMNIFRNPRQTFQKLAAKIIKNNIDALFLTFFFIRRFFFTGCELRGGQVMNYELRITNYELRITGYEADYRVRVYKLRVRKPYLHLI